MGSNPKPLNIKKLPGGFEDPEDFFRKMARDTATVMSEDSDTAAPVTTTGKFQTYTHIILTHSARQASESHSTETTRCQTTKPLYKDTQ